MITAPSLATVIRQVAWHCGWEAPDRLAALATAAEDVRPALAATWPETTSTPPPKRAPSRPRPPRSASTSSSPIPGSTSADRGGHESGMRLVEGAFHCPAMPDDLVEATKTSAKAGSTSRPTKARIQAASQTACAASSCRSMGSASASPAPPPVQRRWSARRQASLQRAAAHPAGRRARHRRPAPHPAVRRHPSACPRTNRNGDQRLR